MDNYLDSIISYVSPSWSAARARKRNIAAAYEAAAPSRTHKAKKETRGANQSVFAAGKSLRDQARWLDENHDIVIGLLDKLEERVVGSRGIMVDPQPLNIDDTVNTEFADEIRKRWAIWSVKPEVTGRFTRPQAERLALRTWLRDGETFGQMLKGNVPGYTYLTDTKFAIELLEPDFIPFQFSEISKKIKQGIRLDSWGRPKGYQVLYDHPGESTGIRFKTKEVLAENMMHLALVKRLHQVRGVSLLHGIIIRLADLKQYEESERVAARIAAALGFYIKKGNPDSYVAPQNEGKKREIEFSPGMTFDNLEMGEEVGMIESNNRPNPGLESFRNGQLRAVAAGSRSSYSSIARDYSGTYSSQRQELVESFEGYSVLQDEFVAQWARPVFRNWLQMELLNMTIPKEIDRQSLFNAVYLAPVMPWIDPKKEAEGWKIQIRGGAATQTEWIQARGKNPTEVMRIRINEINFNLKHDLVTDTNPADDKSGPADEPRPKKSKEDDDDDD